MKLRRQSASLVAGLLTATFGGSLAHLDRAVAQIRQPDSALPDRLAPNRADPGRSGGFSTTVRPSPTVPSRRGADPTPAPPAADATATDPNVDPTVDPNSTDDDAQTRPRTRRPIPVDGDMNWPPPPPQPVDGIIQQDETLPTDGIDPSTTDQRDPKEADAVDGPPAGHDPNAFVGDPTVTTDPFAFEIELDPILDRRPARLARFEPYQPTGIRAGSFTVFPEAEFAFVAQDNLFRSSSNVRRDISLDVRPSIRAVSNWRTHAMEFRATGISTFHNDFKTEDDRGYLIESRGRIDVTRNTNVLILGSHERKQEARGSINAVNTAGGRADIDTDRLALTFNHRFNRLAIQLRGSLTETDYGAVTDNAGIGASNDSRDNSAREAAARASWFFKPNFAAFSEVSVNDREYKAAASDGIRRDSTGDRVRVGLSFGNPTQSATIGQFGGPSGPTLRGEVSIGHARQRFEDARLPEISGIVVDANLAWRVSGLTSVLFNARSDIGESTLVGSGGALSQSAGVEVRHAFMRQLIGTAGVRLTKQDYEGTSISEKDLTSLLGLEYFVNRNVTLFSRYQHVAFDSTNISRNYNADEFRLGVRLRQ